MFASSDFPLVTIVTPSLNQGSFIRGAIESVLGQTYPNIEYIIMDAGSSDETKAVAAEYSNRLVFISEPDRGQSHAINKGWKLGKGEIIAWLCADDLLLPGTVQTIVETFRSHPDASYVFGACELLDRQGRTTCIMPAPEPYTWKLIHGYDYIAQPTAFASRRAVEAVGFVDEALHFGMDWDLFMRLSVHGPAVSVPVVLAKAHVYPETKTSSGGYRRWRELVGIMRRHGERRYPPGYFFYGAETVREGYRRWTRRLPSRLSRLGSISEPWITSACERVHAGAATKATHGWFDDHWAGPRVTRRFASKGRTLALRGRLPNEYPGLVGQRFTVSCDGAVVATLDVSPGSFSWDLQLPMNSRDDGIEIEIAARRWFVPKKCGLNDDVRRLAFYLDELTLA